MASTAPFDCVATYHQNPLTCGVAKFNHILAERMGVPLLGVFDPALAAFKAPLLSIKCEEFLAHDLSRLHDLVQRFPADVTPHLFLHAFGDTLTEFELVKRAGDIYCGNADIYQRLRAHAPAVHMLWSPGTLRPQTASQQVGEITLFSFGMAHKLQAQHYFRVRDLLEKTGRSYTVFLSAALHEGTSFEDAFAVSFDQLRGVFADHVRFLGFLSDDAVVEYMRRATFFTAFFEKGVRDNNSSVVAAMERGSIVITNLDDSSPSFCRHMQTMLDIGQLDELPLDKGLLETMSRGAQASVVDRSWDSLISRFLES